MNEFSSLLLYIASILFYMYVCYLINAWLLFITDLGMRHIHIFMVVTCNIFLSVKLENEVIGAYVERVELYFVFSGTREEMKVSCS